jgi:hypothetical protein
MNHIDQDVTGWAFTIAAIACALGGVLAGLVP